MAATDGFVRSRPVSFGLRVLRACAAIRLHFCRHEDLPWCSLEIGTPSLPPYSCRTATGSGLLPCHLSSFFLVASVCSWY